MRVRLIAPRDLTVMDCAKWGECAASAIEANPFLEPGWLLPALEHLGGYDDVTLLVAEQGGDVQAVVPLITEESTPSHSFLTTRVVPTAVPLGTPLVRTAGASDTLARVLS